MINVKKFLDSSLHPQHYEVQSFTHYVKQTEKISEHDVGCSSIIFWHILLNEFRYVY